MAICPVCKEVASDSLGILEFAFGLVMLFEKFKLKKDFLCTLLSLYELVVILPPKNVQRWQVDKNPTPWTKVDVTIP